MYGKTKGSFYFALVFFSHNFRKIKNILSFVVSQIVKKKISLVFIYKEKEKNCIVSCIQFEIFIHHLLSLCWVYNTIQSHFATLSNTTIKRTFNLKSISNFIFIGWSINYLRLGFWTRRFKLSKNTLISNVVSYL